MNERIFELGKQATIWCCDNVSYTSTKADWDAAWEEKFADLIVRECIALAHGVGDLRGVTDDMTFGADTAALRISKHFGVEYERQ